MKDDIKVQFTVPLSDGKCYGAPAHPGELLRIGYRGRKSLEKKLVLSAAELKRELDAAGRLAVCGIYVDSDKCNIKPESEKSPGEIVKLMKGIRSWPWEFRGTPTASAPGSKIISSPKKVPGR